MSVGKSRISLNGLGRDADSVAVIALLEHISLAAVGAFEARLSVAAEVKPAVTFESKFAAAFVENLVEQFVLAHRGYSRLFGSAAVAAA